ncbi:MAG TPA: outer membrane beta-barrel protein [Burkholderiales bacterium]|nr:outer membrane beta-barrel protein [Burkholderiales bacterium]
MKSAAVTVALALSALALPAAAQMNMSAVYVGATVGQSKFKDACTGLTAGVSCDDQDTAWRILAGYQFNPNFAAELGYHNLGETKASGGGVNASIKATAWELVGLGILPLGNQFGVYGKLGVHHSEAKLNSNVGVTGEDSGNGLTFGAGVQFNVMPALGLRAEWQRYRNLGGESDNGDVDVISIGGIWRFR